MGRRRVLVVEGTQASFQSKVVVNNTPEWEAYKQTVWGILLGDYKVHFRPYKLKPGELLAFDLWWHLRNDRSDCLNYHDLLADALKEALDVDDRFYLFRDRWVYINPEDPHVEMVIRKVREPR
jgi:hypothetical protein